MSSKQIIKKRAKANVIACNKCKRDKKRCDGSYLTQKPCKQCRDRNEYCEYTEPSRLNINTIQENINISSNISNITDDIIQFQNLPLQQDLDKSNVLQLLTDPSTTNEQMIILKRLYNEIIRNPESPNFVGNNKRDELSMKLKLLLSSSTDNDHTRIQIWGDLCSLANELDNNLDSIFNTWNSESLNFSNTQQNFSNQQQQQQQQQQQHNETTTKITTKTKTTTTKSSTRDKPKVRAKKTNDIKKRKTRKNQRENKRTQPYPAGGQIVIRPSKQAHTMIWHQNDPIDDVPIMAFQLQQPITPPTPPPVTVNRPPQRTQFQQPLPSFPHFQSVIPINLWDHSTTTMTMLSPKSSPTFSESEINNNEPTTNSILLSPTPSLHDDIGDIVSSPSNSSIDHTRVISDDEKERFGLISLTTTSTGSPQSPSLFTVEEFMEMYSSSVTDDLPVVEPIWNC